VFQQGAAELAVGFREGRVEPNRLAVFIDRLIPLRVVEQGTGTVEVRFGFGLSLGAAGVRLPECRTEDRPERPENRGSDPLAMRRRVCGRTDGGGFALLDAALGPPAVHAESTEFIVRDAAATPWT
jgi:hypothetical protein